MCAQGKRRRKKQLAIRSWQPHHKHMEKQLYTVILLDNRPSDTRFISAHTLDRLKSRLIVLTVEAECETIAEDIAHAVYRKEFNYEYDELEIMRSFLKNPSHNRTITVEDFDRLYDISTYSDKK